MSGSNRNEDKQSQQPQINMSDLVKMNTNSAIVNACVEKIFAENFRFSPIVLFNMCFKVMCLIAIKTGIEDIGSVINKFKFSDMNFLKYKYQSLKLKSTTFEILKIKDKWTYDERTLSTDNFTNALQKKKIYIEKPATYYTGCRGYLIRVTIKDNIITFECANITEIVGYISSEFIDICIQKLHGGKTEMYKLTCGNNASVMKLEPVAKNLCAYETENYRNLKESLMVESAYEDLIGSNNGPTCISFNGEPGTGKTTFGNYIANYGNFDKIVTCNIVFLAKMKFHEIINHIETRLNGNQKTNTTSRNVLLIIDELDKWLESHLFYHRENIREESRKQKEISDDKKKQTEKKIKMTPEEEIDSINFEHTKFLDDLFKLVNGDTLTNTYTKYVIIFNTNHFEKIFKINGVIPEQYEAVVDRFQRYEFTRIGKYGILEYLKNIRDFVNMSLAKRDVESRLDPEVMRRKTTFDENNINNIHDGFTTTYRELQGIIRDRKYDLNNVISLLIDKSLIEYEQINYQNDSE